MKTWTKRTIAVCLLLALFLTAIPCASAKQYTDVTRSALPDYFDAINYVTDNGIMNGVSTSSFSPNEMVTRAMFITTLYRYAGSPSSFAAVSFTDISSSHYAYNAVKWGVKYNIVTGTTTTTFSPDEQVTREQAMTFLWRYLKNYVGGTPYYYGSISGCGDYSSIYDYARTPMYWAVSNAIIFASGSSKLLYPKAGVYRKELALWITRYGCNVDGIRFGKDNFGFLNSAGNFYSSTTGTKRPMITNYQYSILSYAATSAEMRDIDNMLNAKFQGGCFGMAMSALLDKKGVIDFNKNFEYYADTMYAVKAPTNTANNSHKVVYNRGDNRVFPITESTIVFYTLSQKIESRLDNHILVISQHSLKPVVDALRKYGAVVLGMTLNNGGHTVMLYGMPKLVGTNYEISAYDPNMSGKCTFKISSDHSTCSLSRTSGTLTPIAVEYIADFYGFRALDIDGDYNIYNYTSAAYTEEELSAAVRYNDSQMEGQTWLVLDKTTDCTITNAEGQTLKVSNGIPTGDIEILNSYFVVNNCDEPVTTYYRVPFSNSFNFESDNDVSGFQVRWGANYQMVAGSGIHTVCFTPEKVLLEGSEMDYTMYLSAGFGTERDISIAGEGATKAEAALSNLATQNNTDEANGIVLITSDANAAVIISNILNGEIYANLVAQADDTCVITNIEAASPLVSLSGNDKVEETE